MKRTKRLILAACLAVVWPACAEGAKPLGPEAFSDEGVKPLGPEAFSDIDPNYNKKLNEAHQALSAEREQRRKLEQDAAAKKKLVKELEEALRREREARVAPPRVVPAPQPVQPPPPKPTPVETQSSDKRDCPDMAVIPAGEYVQGDNSSLYSDEKPERTVRIKKPFLLCKTEVTQGQWRAVMGSNTQLYFNSCDDDCPVETVSWNDAQAFIKKLNEQTGKGYRLPSEAEWEYACRAGGRHTYCGGNDIGALAWYNGNSGSETHSVGRKQANAWGLHDMSGNVWEWVEDCGNGSYSGAPTDGSTWTNGDCGRRVLRGGSWGSYSDSLRAANRNINDAGNRDNNNGVRVARTLP